MRWRAGYKEPASTRSASFEICSIRSLIAKPCMVSAVERMRSTNRSRVPCNWSFLLSLIDIYTSSHTLHYTAPMRKLVILASVSAVSICVLRAQDSGWILTNVQIVDLERSRVLDGPEPPHPRRSDRGDRRSCFVPGTGISSGSGGFWRLRSRLNARWFSGNESHRYRRVNGIFGPRVDRIQRRHSRRGRRAGLPRQGHIHAARVGAALSLRTLLL